MHGGIEGGLVRNHKCCWAIWGDK